MTNKYSKTFDRISQDATHWLPKKYPISKRRTNLKEKSSFQKTNQLMNMLTQKHVQLQL